MNDFRWEYLTFNHQIVSFCSGLDKIEVEYSDAFDISQYLGVLGQYEWELAFVNNHITSYNGDAKSIPWYIFKRLMKENRKVDDILHVLYSLLDIKDADKCSDVNCGLLWELNSTEYTLSDVDSNGWRNMLIKLMIKNTSNNWQCINEKHLFSPSSIHIKTTEGYEYSSISELHSSTITTKGIRIPPGLVVRGFIERVSEYSSDYRIYDNSLEFNVADSTNGYKLVFPDHYEIDIAEQTDKLDIDSINLLESKVLEWDNQHYISESGSIKIAEVTINNQEVDIERGLIMNVTIQHTNYHRGYDSYFPLVYYVIGAKGYIYLEYQYSVPSEFENDDHGLCVGPHRTVDKHLKFCVQPDDSAYKLLVNGYGTASDINAIFRLE